MKKSIFDIKAFIIIFLVIILGSVLFYFGIKKANSKYQTFVNDGYIISSANKVGSSNKYYFSANTKYKNNYDETFTMVDTSNKKVNIRKDSFIHYSNDSISSTKKSVLLELKKLSATTLKYYNFYPDSILKYENGTYNLDLFNGKLKLSDYLIKISDNKYMIVAPNVELIIGDEKSSLEKYVELNFLEGNIVRLENNENVFQNISTDMKLKINDTITIDLSNRNILNGNDVIVNLNQITIESNDNIDIPNNATTTTTRTTKSVNITTTVKPNNSSGTNGIMDSETEVDENKKIIDPSFRIYDLAVTTYSMQCKINVDDPNNAITGAITLKVFESNTGIEVDETTMTSWYYDIPFESKKLSSNTDYTFIVTAVVNKNGEEFTKNFVQKTFRTESLGVNIEKDYFTENEMHFIVSKDKYSDVKSAMAVLTNVNTHKEYTYDLKFENPTEELMFTDLDKNTKYVLSITNFDYYGLQVQNTDIISKTYQTLKEKPTSSSKSGNFGDTNFNINNKDGILNLMYDNINDPDDGIIEYKYEIYSVGNSYELENSEGNSKPIKTIISKNRENVLAYIDGQTLERDKNYVYKVIVKFNDNEKIIEYTSGFSKIINLTGAKVPTISFEEQSISYNKIKGNIKVSDAEGVIDITKPITIVFKDTYGNNKTVTYSNISNYRNDTLYTLPVLFENLTSNVVYMVDVIASTKFSDENVYSSYLLGTLYLKTATTIPFRIEWDNDDSSNSNCSTPFVKKFKLVSSETSNPENDALFQEQLLAIGTVKITIKNLQTNMSTTIPLSLEDLNILRSGEFVTITADKIYGKKDFASYFNATDQYSLIVSSIIDKKEENSFEMLSVSTASNFYSCISKLPYYNDLKQGEYIAVNESFTEDTITLEDGTTQTENNSSGFSVSAGFKNDYNLVNSITYYLFDASDTSKIREYTIQKENFNSDSNKLPYHKFVYDTETDEEDWFKRGGEYKFSYSLNVNILGTDSTPEYTCDYPAFQMTDYYQEQYSNGATIDYSQISECKKIEATQNTSNNKKHYKINNLINESNSYQLNKLVDDITTSESPDNINGKIEFSSSTYYPYKRIPMVLMFPIGLDSTIDDTYDFAYKIVDVDNVLKGSLIYNGDNVDVNICSLYSSCNFSTLKLPLNSNKIRISSVYSLTKDMNNTLYNNTPTYFNDIPTEIIKDDYYSNLSSTENFVFNHKVDESKSIVKISFKASDEEIKRLSKIDMVFHDADSFKKDETGAFLLDDSNNQIPDNSSDILINNIAVNSDNYKIMYDDENAEYYFIIPLANISSLISKNITTKAIVYYDSGEYGYDFVLTNEFNKNNMYTLKYRDNNAYTYLYCFINKNGVQECSNNTSNNLLDANGSTFKIKKSDVSKKSFIKVGYNSIINNINYDLNMRLSSYGYITTSETNNNDLNILPSKIKSYSFDVSNKNTFSFNSVSPVFILTKQSVSPVSVLLEYNIAGLDKTDQSTINFEVFDDKQKSLFTNSFVVNKDKTTSSTIDFIGYYKNTDFKKDNIQYEIKAYYVDPETSEKIYLKGISVTNDFITYVKLSDYYHVTYNDVKLTSSKDDNTISRYLKIDYDLDNPTGFDSIRYEVFDEEKYLAGDREPIATAKDEITGKTNYVKDIKLEKGFVASTNGTNYLIFVEPYKESIKDNEGKPIALTSEESSKYVYNFRNFFNPVPTKSIKRINKDDTKTLQLSISLSDLNYVVKDSTFKIEVYDKETNLMIFSNDLCTTDYLNTFDINVLSFEKEYLLKVIYDIDINNDTIYETQEYESTIEKGNAFGITFGDLSLTVDKNFPVIYFYKSDKIDLINRVDYSLTYLDSSGTPVPISDGSITSFKTTYFATNNVFTIMLKNLNVTSYDNFYLTIHFYAGEGEVAGIVYDYSGLYTRSN